MRNSGYQPLQTALAIGRLDFFDRGELLVCSEAACWLEDSFLLFYTKAMLSNPKPFLL